MTPGAHPLVARAVSPGVTLPVLVVGGRAISDSTAIIAELERRHPDPPLYPEDPGERRRALELEDFLDEELGPYTRMLTMHHTLPDPDLWLAMFMPDINPVRRAALRRAFPQVAKMVRKEFRLDAQGVENAHAKIRAAGERVAEEGGGGEYLVGGRFTVADLTLAALLSPAAAPEQFPYAQPQRGHPRLAPLREAMAEAGLLDGMSRTYERHRYQNRHTAVTTA